MSREVENDEYARFVQRAIRGMGRRVADGDVEGLADLLALSDVLDQAVTDAVRGLRGHEYSWAEIGRSAGVTRQSAHSRWGTRRQGIRRQDDPDNVVYLRPRKHLNPSSHNVFRDNQA